MVEGSAFEVEAIPFNPDGWGPDGPLPLLSNHPTHVPFAPFFRLEKLGHIADWTRTYNNHSARPSNNPRALDESAAADDDSTFLLVYGKPPPRPKFGPKWLFQQHRPLPQRRDDQEVEARKRKAEKERARRNRARG